MKHALFILTGLTALSAGCGNSGEGSASQKEVAAVKPKKQPAFCFFKDSEMKDWAAKRDAQGNIVLSGKAHVKDSRYKAVMGPPQASGGNVEIAPTLTLNTGYEAPDDWWDLSATIPNSAKVTKIAISCGAKNAAALEVPPNS